MRRFEQRRDPTLLLWRRIWAVVLLIILAIGIRGMWGVYQKQEESRQLRIEAEAKLIDLRDREAKLRDDISDLSTDRGVEQQLRERYNYVKEDEGAIVIVEPQTQDSQMRTRKERVREFLSW